QTCALPICAGRSLVAAAGVPATGRIGRGRDGDASGAQRPPRPLRHSPPGTPQAPRGHGIAPRHSAHRQAPGPAQPWSDSLATPSAALHRFAAAVPAVLAVWAAFHHSPFAAIALACVTISLILRALGDGSAAMACLTAAFQRYAQEAQNELPAAATTPTARDAENEDASRVDSE